MKWGGQQMCNEELHRRAVQIVLQPGESRQKLVTCMRLGVYHIRRLEKVIAHCRLVSMECSATCEEAKLAEQQLDTVV